MRELRQANPTTRRVQAGQTLRVPQGAPAFAQAQINAGQNTGTIRPAEGLPGMAQAQVNAGQIQANPNVLRQANYYGDRNQVMARQYNRMLQQYGRSYPTTAPGSFRQPTYQVPSYIPQTSASAALRQIYPQFGSYYSPYGYDQYAGQGAGTQTGVRGGRQRPENSYQRYTDLWTLDPTTGLSSPGGGGYGGFGGYSYPRSSFASYGPQAGTQRFGRGFAPSATGRNYAAGLGLTSWRF